MDVIQVCNEDDCGNEPYQELVGKIATWYCCKNGFFKMVDAFGKHYANQYKCHVCNDEHFVEHHGKSMPCPAGCYLNPPQS